MASTAAMKRPSRISSTGAAFCLILGAIGFTVSAAAAPKPGDHGLAYCATNNDDSVGGLTVLGDEHTCCHWEGDGKGGALRVCLECDENWENCKETIPSRGPSTTITTPGGAIRQDPSGAGSNVPAGTLVPKLQLQRRSN